MNKNKESLVISAFGAIGKTHFAAKYPRIAIDLEAIPYKYIYLSKQDQGYLAEGNHEPLKGAGNRTFNPEYPSNYVHEIMACLGKYSLILVVLSPETLLALEQNNIDYSVIYPDIAMKLELLERMRHRGNNRKFLSKIDTILSSDTEQQDILSNLHPRQLITAHSGEYLEDILQREYPNIFI